MKLAIVGSRSITDIIQLKGAWIQREGDLNYYYGPVTEIVSGGARGVDTLAKQLAEESGIKFTEMKPDGWTAAHFYARNQRIVDYVDAMLALWDGRSGGTIDAVKRARAKGIPVWLCTCWRNPNKKELM